MGLWRMIAKTEYAKYEYMNIDVIIEHVFGVTPGGDVEMLYSAIRDAIGNVETALSGLGIAICVVLFLISLVEFANSERLTVETFIKFFAKLIIGVFLVSNASTLSDVIFDFGKSITALIANINVGGGGNIPNAEAWIEAKAQQLSDENGNNIMVQIGYILNSVLITLLSVIVLIVITVVVYIISFSRMLELYIRRAFMPIALSLVTDDGWKGSAGRYIKKYLAICSQGAILLIIGRIMSYGMIASAQLADGVFVTIGIGVAGIAIMFKSITLLNDVFGA